MRPKLVPVEDDWFEWREGPRRATRVLVRIVEAKDGRHRIAGLRLEGTVSAEVLRAIPIGRIEAAANAQLHPGAGTAPVRRVNARIAGSLRANAVQGYPDSFYEAVAAAYRQLVGASSRPIGELAAANDVPVTTAQRWVREARRRGKLPPGHPGKAG